VQGLGGLVEPNNGAHAADLTRRLAAALGGVAILLPAPGVVGTAAARVAFAQDPYVQDGLRRARSATLAIMGIGVPRQDSVLMRNGTTVRWRELADLTALGAVGDINLRYFDAQGQPMRSELDSRVIGLSLDELHRIERVVGVAGGAVKFDAIRAALRGHLINTLVTDHETARRLLQSP
jgi:DNA-binding transcriptional regulator LsrR (DeoR family)